MKKVELITLQDVPNYGSVLQAYATQKTFEKLGYECEIIKYTPERMTKLGMLKNIKHKSEKFGKSLLWRTAARIIIFPSYIKRFRTFKKFRKKYLNETSKTYRTNEEIKAANLKADIYCTGSDQVWNSGWNDGIDKAMFLDFAPKNAKCITYAASFGKNKLDKNEIKQTKKLLEKYESISVRESSAVDILKELGIKSTNVVDPTLLLSGDEWRELSSNKFKNEKYILVYNLNRNNKIDEYAQKVAKKNGLKVKYISYQLHEKYKKGKVYCSPSIEDFIALIDNAKLVISDSFHATAFSVNLNTDFAIVLPDKYSTRLSSFLSCLSLKERIADNNDELAQINYQLVNTKLLAMRNKSIGWIKEKA
ncbi:polysaccharide pyruvyl transferase family protein [Candidatus Saccharibacteria bacterium]|nr:polysaccharide pyruvyl transferase family protein [Candidatus Saccharibacteria bacterium]MBR3377767.1 polysaccharide pyruvyl transferase family protein [Candidatus Saccharibacteria bacterium]